MRPSRAKTGGPGWAAFDLKQRRRLQQCPPTDADSLDPFPPIIPSTSPITNPITNPITRSFSSILLPYSRHDFLKGIYCWADESLIEDVMAATNDDFGKASAVLKDMVPTSSTIQINCQGNDKTDRSCIAAADVNEHHDDDDGFCNDESAMVVDLDDSSTDDVKLILSRFKSLTLEPESEEEEIDLYLKHRKHALRIIRSAAQHSRAATNAFIKGDHFSAQQCSFKAREKWLTAERLNTNAAKEILSVRNNKNDLWKLDLHGLHAAEAVQVLQQHLFKIESKLPSNRSLSPNRSKIETHMIRSSSVESFSCAEEKQRASLRQRESSLQVITGIGKHSRGQAALPTAVRGFLNENKYRFEELRPGVIAVWPKYRHK